MALEIEDFVKLGGAALAGGASYAGAQDAIGALSQAGTNLSTAYGNVSTEAQQKGQFTPYTVTSGAGNVGLNAGNVALAPSSVQTGLLGQAGTMTSGLNTGLPNQTGLANQAFTQSGTALGQNTGQFASQLGGLYAGMGENQLAQQMSPQNLQALQAQFAQQGMSQQTGSLGDLTGQLQQAASGAFGGATPTAQSVYDQIRATQSPEEERQRIALENRLAAQGRLGLETSMYGGTPEQFSMDKAQAEARNSASLQAMSMADQLTTSQQSRASQLAQLGMSAEQIDSQLATEGLGRQTQSAGLAGNLAQTGSGIEAQNQQLGQGLLGLGLQAQQLGGSLGSQDIANAASMFGIGQQASMADEQEQAIRLANLNQMLQSSGIPLEQQLATANLGLSARAQEQANQQNLMNLLSNIGLSEAGMLKELALGEAGVTQEMIKSFGNIGAGLAGMNLQAG